MFQSSMCSQHDEDVFSMSSTLLIPGLSILLVIILLFCDGVLLAPLVDSTTALPVGKYTKLAQYSDKDRKVSLMFVQCSLYFAVAACMDSYDITELVMCFKVFISFL